MRILLVEDDPDLGHTLKQDLGHEGFLVDLVDEGKTAEFQGATELYDLVILDLGLPDLPGLEVLSRWRSAGIKVPVLILTARSAWQERVDGFKAGADDYLGKPFHREELIARIRAILKRSHGHSPGQLNLMGLALDEDTQTVTIDGAPPLRLSGMEFRMLRAFMLHPGQVLSKTHLSEHVFSTDNEPDSNIIEVYVTKLRQKIGHERIETRRGQGYTLVELKS